MDARLKLISETVIIAVVRLDDLSKAIQLTETFANAGIKVIEFTLTNPDAVATIASVQKAMGTSILLGAGSVLTASQVREVADAGAQFIVSPVMKTELIEASKECGLLSIIGAYTPTEIQTAWEAGADLVKVFPARNLGADYIKDVLAPLPHLRLIPTGGISPKHVAAYMKAGVFGLGAGGALVDKEAIAKNDWQSITATARAYVQAVEEARA